MSKAPSIAKINKLLYVALSDQFSIETLSKIISNLDQGMSFAEAILKATGGWDMLMRAMECTEKVYKYLQQKYEKREPLTLEELSVIKQLSPGEKSLYFYYDGYNHLYVRFDMLTLKEIIELGFPKDAEYIVSGENWMGQKLYECALVTRDPRYGSAYYQSTDYFILPVTRKWRCEDE
jgi:hypothetical protein